MKIIDSWWRPSEFRIPKAFLFSIMKILIHVVTSFLKVLLAAAANSSVSYYTCTGSSKLLRKVPGIWSHSIKFTKVLYFCVISPNYVSGFQNPCLSLSIIKHRGLIHLRCQVDYKCSVSTCYSKNNIQFYSIALKYRLLSEDFIVKITE